MITKERTLRGKVAIAGIGETRYYKHAKVPFTLVQWKRREA